jgi:hypothetical protein
VHRAGAGPQPLAAEKLAPARLASAICTAIDDSARQARTAQLSERIAQEAAPPGLPSGSSAPWPSIPRLALVRAASPTGPVRRAMTPSAGFLVVDEPTEMKRRRSRADVEESNTPEKRATRLLAAKSVKTRSCYDEL